MLSREEVLTILEAHREEIARFGVKSLRLFGSVAGMKPRRRATWTSS